MPRKKINKSWDLKSSDVLREKLESWKLTNNKTNDDFASEIGVTRSQLQRILNGKSNPSSDVFDKIAEVLACRQDDFFPKYDEWSYKYSPEYQSKFVTKLNDFADEIGLNPDLLPLLKELVNFNEEFPVYSNLVIQTDAFAESPVVRNPNFICSAKLKGMDSVYQMTHEGQNITLSFADILFLKDLQDSLIKHIQKQFAKRRKEMSDEVDTANKSVAVEFAPGAFAYRPFTEERYLSADKYARKIKEYLEGGKKNGKH